ncbi:MFS general substrate transporter [Phanerochaete sordida]|uniref:MFS general substrate transporter n=1 Tax=Phanerochaete sordida TaxID=48140 RepID=A0A9P3GBR0_9APHY|nr:MFS general substrate transporter [Phanerochaete sordida]
MGRASWSNEEDFDGDGKLDSDIELDDKDEPESETYDTLAQQELERKLLWKVDKRMSILVLLYILNIVDRNNVAAARLRGFEEDLGLKGQQFATVLSVLYVGYITMQIPSNLFLNHIGRPSMYLSISMVTWGVLSIMTGLARNFNDVLLTRLLFGTAEASFFPGALFLLSRWYTPVELGARTALLLCGSIAGNAVGALAASALLELAPWRWLFYTEGAATLAAALLAARVLPDFPESAPARWLTSAEARLAVRRMRASAAPATLDAHAGGAAAALRHAVADANVWLFLAALAAQMLAGSGTDWYPTVVATLGYSRRTTLLLCAAPYPATGALTYWVARHSDRTRERFWHTTIPVLVAAAGMLLALTSQDVRVRYVSLYALSLSLLPARPH